MINLVGLESEIHVGCVGDVPHACRSSLVDMVLEEIRQQQSHHNDKTDEAQVTISQEFLANGMRCYNDHGYLEVSTPPLANTVEAVAAVRAGDRIVRSAVESVQGLLNDNVRLFAVRNNTDHSGHSYGAHVNVRMSRQAFERLFGDERLFHGVVVPFFATLPLICGAGCAGGKDGENTFHTWQRGGFTETLVGDATQTNRPLVNTRDESLSADPVQCARLHVIHLDAVRSETAEYCKLGLLKLFGAAVDYVGWSGTSYELDNAIYAVRSVTASPFHPLRLKSKKTATPLAIQRNFFESFSSLQEEGVFDSCVPDARDILEQVDEVLTTLEQDPFDLVGSLDWITKSVWLEEFRTCRGLDWSDPRMKWADIQYHNLIGQDGFELPKLRRITSESQVQSLIDAAPKGSRARIRGTILRKFGHELADLDWHWFVGRDSSTAFFLPDDPTEEALGLAEHAKTLDDLARTLRLQPVPVRPLIVVPLSDRKEACLGTESVPSKPLSEV